MHFQENIAIGM